MSKLHGIQQHRPKLNQPEFPPLLVSAFLLRSFPSEHHQDHPVVCVNLCLPNLHIKKGVSARAKDVVPSTHYLSVLPSHTTCPATVSSVPFTWHVVSCHVFQSTLLHHCRTLLLPRFVRFS